MKPTSILLSLGLAALLSACSHGDNHFHDEGGDGAHSHDHVDGDEHGDHDGAAQDGDELAAGQHADAGPAGDADHVADEGAAGLYALGTESLSGDAVDLSAYAGKVTLVVNVASECGYTPQYAGLQTLHENLADHGFAVLGFPSNEFGGQEPGSAAEIQAFCSGTYGVDFPMFAKCVTGAGEGQSPIYGLLGEATGKLPNWNFCKYLIGRDGQVIDFYPSKVAPESAELLADIEAALAG